MQAATAKEAHLRIGKYGSILHLDRPDPTNPRKRLVTCGGQCGGNEYYTFPKSRREKEKMEALCPECSPRKISGRVKLPKGSVVDFDDRLKINPESGGHPYYKVAMECRGCFAATGVKKYVLLYKVRGYIKGTLKKGWPELCTDFWVEESHQPKVSGVLYADGENPTEFHIPKDLTTPVRYIYGKCRHEYKTGRENALTNYRVIKNICPACRKDPEAYRLRMQELEGTGKANGMIPIEKKSRGRKTGDRLLSPERVKADFESIVLSLNKKLPQHKISREEIAAAYHRRGERLDRSSVTKRVQSIYGKGTSVADAVALVLQS